MRTTIDYSTLQEPEKSKRALADIENYLGKDRMARDAKILKGLNPRFEAFQGACGLFIGIEGFPVQAWFNHLFPEQKVE